VRTNKWLIVYIAFTCVIFLYGIYLLPKKAINFSFLFPPSSINTIKLSEIKKVIRVVDGDTIEIEGKIKVRYIGIDTPETVDPRKEVQCFGVEASNKNKELVEGKMIRMKKDISNTDKYGRLLRYVWLADTSATSTAELFINDYLVRQGFAHASTFPPDVAYSKQFIEAQSEAQKNNKGLWNKCK